MATQHTKPWHKCPECGSKTILYCEPAKYAGIWECQNPKCGVSDSCDHSVDELLEPGACLYCGVAME